MFRAPPLNTCISSLSEELRRLIRSKRPRSRVRSRTSALLSQAPRKVCGSRRLSLARATGSLGCRVPTFSRLLDARSLAVRPSSPYSSWARLGFSRSACSSPVPLRSGLESSLTPSRPRASTPTPTGPSVKPDS
ncbi:hypothetical protein D9M69_481090 [compost metagenome]